VESKAKGRGRQERDFPAQLSIEASASKLIPTAALTSASNDLGYKHSYVIASDLKSIHTANSSVRERDGRLKAHYALRPMA
jgi:hypothetical protein